MLDLKKMNYDKLYETYQKRYNTLADRLYAQGLSPNEEIMNKSEFKRSFIATHTALAAEKDGERTRIKYGKGKNSLSDIARYMAQNDVYRYSSKTTTHYMKAVEELEKKYGKVNTSFWELRTKDLEDTELGKLLNKYNEDLKKQGITNSKQRSLIIGQQFYGSN